jgi:lambda family phage portal protein
MFDFLKRKNRKSPFNFGVRSFSAAEMSRILRPWTFDKGFDNQEIESQQRTIVARSREMYKNSAHMKRFVSLFETNVVGDGFKLKSTPYDGVAGQKDYKLDTSAARYFEDHFWKWANNPKWCDATGRKTLVEIDRMCVKNWARDGEYFIIIYRGQPNPYGISLRVIRPDACDSRYRATASNGNPVRGGVELDANTMAPVAYYVQTTKEYSSVSTALGNMRRIPAFDPEKDQAESMIHGYTQEEEDQTRGIPLSHAILKKLKMLDELDIAELVAAKDEACTVHSYESTNNNPETFIDLTTAEGSAMANTYMQEKEAGMSEILPAGWTRKTNTPQHPNMQLVPFKATMLKDIASGVNVEHANFSNDWAGVSYSSVRQGTLSERDMWMTMQDRYMGQCKTPVYLAWMRSFLANEVSGGFMIMKFWKFKEHYFRGRRWGWVDPMRDMRANEVARLHGWKSDTQIAEDFGGDFEDTVDQIKRDDEIKKGTSLEVKNEQEKQITA